jgi:hypothetical protein
MSCQNGYQCWCFQIRVIGTPSKPPRSARGPWSNQEHSNGLWLLSYWRWHLGPNVPDVSWLALLGHLITFGNPFGLALYDKQQHQVSSSVAPTTATSAPLAQKTREALADIPLEPPVIAGLQERIKALLPARLEAFSKGFRAAFQVPEAQPSLAGLITTSRHQRWIEGFLAESAAA